MQLNDYISLLSLLVAAAAFFYTYISNTKKYELSSSYRKEILDWYSKAIEVLISTRNGLSISDNRDFIREQQSKLSSLIEVGRFYFPNIDKNDGFGKSKPLAYRGYRNLVLDFLVYSHQILNRNDAEKYISHLEYLQRHFTSHVFEILNPRIFLNETKRYTNKQFSKEFIYEDFLEQEPSAYNININL